jgi:hypothetical protein
MIANHRIFGCLILFGFLLGCSKTAPLKSPQPISLPPDPHAVEAGIARAVAERGWVVQDRQPGRVRAIHTKADKSVTVDIVWDAATLTVNYVGSQNLLEGREGNAIVIHKNVNRWLANLEKDLSAYISVAPMQPPPPGAPPPPPPPPPPAP